MMAEKVDGVVIVYEEGKKFEVSDDEKSCMNLGPKFCVVGGLSEEEFETSVEESIAKLKWDRMGEELNNKKEDLAMVAINEVIDEDQKEDLREHEMMVEGEKQAVHLMDKERSNRVQRKFQGNFTQKIQGI